MVFECSDMPEEVYIIWDRIFNDREYNIYLDWAVGSLTYRNETDEDTLIIDDWLISNGALPMSIVIISRDKN